LCASPGVLESLRDLLQAELGPAWRLTIDPEVARAVPDGPRATAQQEDLYAYCEVLLRLALVIDTKPVAIFLVTGLPDSAL
jgi:hypothetical protein